MVDDVYSVRYEVLFGLIICIMLIVFYGFFKKQLLDFVDLLGGLF